MMKKLAMKAALAALGVAVLSTAAVYAAKHNDEDDALAVSQAKFTLAQAVTTAEQHVQGRASRAEYERNNGVWAYDVEVVSGQKVFDVKVDANTGAVLASNEDKGDHETGNHEDGDQEGQD